MAEAVDANSLIIDLVDSNMRSRSPFYVLRDLCALVNDRPDDALTIEAVLRALNRENLFGEFDGVLNAIARTMGLFPYVDPDKLTGQDQLAYEVHRPPGLDGSTVFHRVQAEVYRELLEGMNVILSAPTSFGKSKIIDAMIATDKFTNIAIVVPTLALIDETRRRLGERFRDRYKVVSNPSQGFGKRNLLVLTPERVVAMEALPKCEFFVIDEFYKLDDFNEDSDPSRTVALNHAFYKLWKGGGQFYLLGPNIERIGDGIEAAYSCKFMHRNFPTVVLEQKYLPGPPSKQERLLKLLAELDGQTLVFCSSPAKANAVARLLLEHGIGVDTPSLELAARWAGETYHPDWVFPAALRHGIGIHHGKLPRSLAQFGVRKFNEGELQLFVCTSTLIEGVNTKAKNVVIYDSAINNRPLDFFTFSNIRGRAGRMKHHFVGRVFYFDPPPEENFRFVDFPLINQGEHVPESLLLQLDANDRSAPAKGRVSKYQEQQAIPVEVLRLNGGIDLAGQLALAEDINENHATMAEKLGWAGIPGYDQRKFVCELIWKHFFPEKKRVSGVSSGHQLATKLYHLYKLTTKERIAQELKPGKYAAESADIAVEKVMEFERQWAGHDFPRYLMAVHRIQESLLPRYGHDPGDYTAYAAMVEALFGDRIIAMLDEYGVPAEIGAKLRDPLGRPKTLDECLERLRTLDLSRVSLTPFEREVVKYAQAGL